MTDTVTDTLTDTVTDTVTQVGPDEQGQPVDGDVHTRAATITAADVMSAPVITVSRRDTLWSAWGLLYRSGFRHLVVVEGTRCLGVLDERRIVAEWPLGPIAPHRRTVGDVVIPRTHCVLPGTSIRIVSRVMLEERTDAVPVVTERGDIVGLVTAGDLIAVLAV